MAPLTNVSEVVARFLKTRQPHGEKEFYAWAESEKIPAVMQDTCWKAIAEQPEKFELKDCLPTDAEFFLDQFGAAVCRWKNQIRHVRSTEFRRQTIRWLDGAGKYSQNNLSALIDFADAIASLSDAVHELHVRCVEGKDGDIWLDLCNDRWEAVRITPGKWEVVANPPPLFRRYPHMREIKIAEEGAREDFDEYLAMLHLKGENDRILHTAATGTAWVPGIPKPIEIAHGRKGSGKTSLCEYTRQLIDPSELATLSLSRDEAQMAQKLMHHYVTVFDNAHELTQLQSDMLCRASTGEGFSKRQLYSDEGDVIFRYRRMVMLTGLNLPGSQPDLLDRAILLELERIPKTERRRKAQLDKRMEELAPRVRRYALDMLAKALTILPEVPEKNLPRMADFAYYGEAFTRAMGYPAGAFFEAYNANIEAQTEEAVMGSFVGELVAAFMEGRKRWEGSAEELLAELARIAGERSINTKDNAFPKRGNSLSRKLNILAADFEELGIRIERSKGGGGARKITLRRITSGDACEEGGTATGIATKSAEVRGDSGDLGDSLQSPLFSGETAGDAKGVQNTATIATSPLTDENTGGDGGAAIPNTDTTMQSGQKVLFLKECEWVGASGQTHGPFKAGQEAELPIAEAARAIKNGLAKPMDGA